MPALQLDAKSSQGVLNALYRVASIVVANTQLSSYERDSPEIYARRVIGGHTRPDVMLLKAARSFTPPGGHGMERILDKGAVSG